ncbi:MAG TPA: hypothetical protein VNE38_16290 [Ktedonobacteraceae bacterium]|nr:hypothetical protein [Ktedonobacteraceae bacterium]
MPESRRYPLMRRFLFPYSGEEALTPGQGARVLLAWAILLPLIMSLLIVVLAILMASSLQRILMLFGFAFVSGMCIFGILGLLIVLVNNRSARIRRAWKAQRGPQSGQQ